ncbi:GTP-binding protein [Streptomyces sp. F63]|nr:GTP-binding protein [Streptomyces sp. F63]
MPVTVVAGLHSDARRRTVETLLRVPGTVVLPHDLAEAADGTVLRTVRDADGVLESGRTPLVNDCACCALREDLVPALNRLAESGEHRLGVVELWDSVEPQGMAEVLAGHAGETFVLTAVVTAVDPALVLPYAACGDDLAEAGLAAAPGDRRTVADTFARQLEYPPLVAVSEGEERPDPADAELLRQLTPATRRLPAGSDELARAVLAGFDAGAAAARQHPACALLPQEAERHGVSTLLWQRRRPFHPGRLHAALEDLTCAALRSRGRFWLADRPDTLLSWDAAGGALCVEESGPWLAALPDAAWELVPAGRRVAAALDWHPVHGDRSQCLSFVSPELDREGLLALLESCLLTDAEYGTGPADWRSLHPAFDELLNPVR